MFNELDELLSLSKRSSRTNPRYASTRTSQSSLHRKCNDIRWLDGRMLYVNWSSCSRKLLSICRMANFTEKKHWNSLLVRELLKFPQSDNRGDGFTLLRRFLFITWWKIEFALMTRSSMRLNTVNMVKTVKIWPANFLFRSQLNWSTEFPEKLTC